MASYTADGSIIIDAGMSTEDFTRGSDELLKAIKDLTASVEALGNKITTTFSNISASFVETARGGATATRSVSGLEGEIDKLADTTGKLGDRAGTEFKSADDVLSYTQKIQDAEAQVELLEERLEAFGNTEVPTEKYIELTAEIEKAQEELDGVKAKVQSLLDQGYTMEQINWLDPDLLKQGEAVFAQLEELKDWRSKIDPSTSMRDTEEYERMAEQLEIAKENIELAKSGIDSEALAQAQLNVQIAQEAVLNAQNASEREKAVQQLREAQAALKSLAADMTGKAAPAAEETAQQVKKIHRESKKAHAQANLLAKTFTSFARMFKTRLKRMFISSIFNSFKEGIKGLALFSPDFDKSISNVKNSMKELARNITVLIAPIVQTVEPFLTRVLQGVSKIFTYINSLLAALQGKNTVIVAKKKTDSYAASLRGAASAAKELNAQVYGFDQLNKRQSASDASGASSAASDLTDMFEEMEIANVVSGGFLEFIDELKSKVADGDWLGFGATLADGLNQLMDEASNFDLSPVSRGINNTLKVVKGFITKTDWRGMGRRIGQAANNIVKAIADIDWTLVGEDLSAGFNGVIDSLIGFIDTFDWFEACETIFEAVGKIIDGINWGQIALRLNRLAISLMEALVYAVLGSVSGVSKWLEDFFRDLGMDGVADFFSGAADAMGDAKQWLKTEVFDPIEQDFDRRMEDAWNEVNGTTDNIKKKSGETGKYIIDQADASDKALTKAARSASSGASEAAKAVQNSSNAAASTVKKDTADATKDASDGVAHFTGLASPMMQVVGKVAEAVVGSTQKTVEASEEAVKGSKEGLELFWEQMKTGAEESKNWTDEQMEEARNSVKGAIADVNKIQQDRKQLQDNENSIWNRFKNAFTTSLDAIKTKATEVAGGVKTELEKPKWNDVGSGIGGKVKSGIQSAFSAATWSNIGSSMATGVGNGLSASWATQVTNKVKEMAQNTTDQLKRFLGIHSPSTVWRDEIGKNLDAGLGEGIEAGMASVLSITGELADKLTGSMDDVTLMRNSAALAAGGFRIPQIAAGTVIPAKTRISASGTADSFYGANTALLGGVDEQLDDQTYVLKQILAALKGLNLNIDSASLARVISAQQRTRELNYGGM